MAPPRTRGRLRGNVTRTERQPARLALEDGLVLTGRGFGADRETIGELVFNTSITGYQEILTDPSYRGQTVLLTQPHIGNYGVNGEDEESGRLWLSGLIVREAARRTSSFRAVGDLHEYLVQHGVPGIERVDTRMLTRRVRDAGAMRVLITRDLDSSAETLVERVRSAPSISAEDHVAVVTTPQVIEWTRSHESPFAARSPGAAGPEALRLRVVAYDFGAKRNILRSLVASGFDLTVVPANTPAEAVLERDPDGVFLSNGPGDPAVVDYAVRAARALVQKVPVFGICLGHQILAQVFGATTFKMKFGHHGGNQPVMDLQTEKVEITSQNHSFAVDPERLPESVEVTHVNLNDHTVEGLRHRELPTFSVQYHPEAAPGPHDALYLFDRFRALIEGARCS
ncbi:MAG: glutamine-hydrolyzing carbamoyl-phosphate synthase small subunit [Planctomycetes bacterium]|nr:glutamine-hydrolyzing carbamoyl-phosphate synthase small subunit [Planctomycetota bacterium]